MHSLFMELYLFLIRMMSKEEFVNKLEDKQLFEQFFLPLFDQADKNNNGFIESSELYDCIKSIATEGFNKKAPSKEEVEKVLKEHDTNKDGKLSKEEFTPFLKKVLIELFDAGLLN